MSKTSKSRAIDNVIRVLNGEKVDIINSSSSTTQSINDLVDYILEWKKTDNYEVIENFLMASSGKITANDSYNTIKVPITSGKIKIKDEDFGTKIANTYKYAYFNSTMNMFNGGGCFIEYMYGLNLTDYNKSVYYKDGYIIVDFDYAKKEYTDAYYICITIPKTQEIEILYCDKSKVNNDFEKPFVIFDFDWYENMYSKRYAIVKGEYNWNATFCLDNQTTVHALDNNLTRAQFDEMIGNGWDCALYGGVGTEGTNNATYNTFVKGLVTQKDLIGIFDHVCYNTIQNKTDSFINRAAKGNGFLLQRATNPRTNDLLLSKNQFVTGANFMSTTTVDTIKSQIDKAVQKKCGVVLYTHLVITDSSDITDGADSSAGHCYETSFRKILDYIKDYVDKDALEVLSMREYLYKYRRDEILQKDYQNNHKYINYIKNN